MSSGSNHSASPPGRRRRKRVAAALASALCLVGIALAASPPREWRQYPGVEYYDYELPTDYQVPAEWTFARLMYPPYDTYRSFRRSWRSDWQTGGTSWTIDYPRADRHIVTMVRRLTAVDARSVEQPVNLDDGDDVFNWPWLYAVEVGTWDLSDSQAAQLREYLLRGGFLMVDDFHGSDEWQIFLESMRRVFPDRPVVDIPNDDPIFHTFWDLDDRQQIPGAQFLYSGRTYEQISDPVAHWRGIFDDEGRVMVAICHNMDLGDAVEHSDTPDYPEEYSAQAMRAFINYILYDLTH
jgi:uncharacterized protein DUF4159